MKKILLILLVSFTFLTGCENKEEEEKNEYLAMKSNLLETKKYTNLEEIMCDIIVDINRLDEEQVEYSVSLTNPKENMRNVKVIVVHNYYTEEIFPTIGLFDKTIDLYINSNKEEQTNLENNNSITTEEENVIKLTGIIKTTNDIDNLNLELKILIEYTNEFGDIKDIYYKTTK